MATTPNEISFADIKRRSVFDDHASLATYPYPLPPPKTRERGTKGARKYSRSGHHNSRNRHTHHSVNFYTNNKLTIWFTLINDVIDRGCYVVGKMADNEILACRDTTNMCRTDMDTCNSTSIPRQPVLPVKHRVAFDTVTVRDYHVTLGDHPSCTKGVPLSLDWEYTQLPPKKVDAYEYQRGPKRRKERTELVLSSFQRKEILGGLGFSRKEMKQRKRELRRIQRQRRTTQLLLPMHTFFQEAFQSKQDKLQPKKDEKVPLKTIVHVQTRPTEV